MEHICCTSNADINKTNYISEIKEQRTKIKKNFNDMDLENATAKNEIESAVNAIIQECNLLISKLESI